MFLPIIIGVIMGITEPKFSVEGNGESSAIGKPMLVAKNIVVVDPSVNIKGNSLHRNVINSLKVKNFRLISLRIDNWSAPNNKSPAWGQEACFVCRNIHVRKVSSRVFDDRFSAPARIYFHSWSFAGIFYCDMNCERFSYFRHYWVWINSLDTDPSSLIKPKVRPLLVQLSLHSSQLIPKYGSRNCGQNGSDTSTDSGYGRPTNYAIGNLVLLSLFLSALFCGCSAYYFDRKWPATGWFPLSIFAIFAVISVVFNYLNSPTLD